MREDDGDAAARHARFLLEPCGNFLDHWQANAEVVGADQHERSLLVIADLPVASIPTIALTLNLIVTSAGGYHFIRSGHARPALIVPFLISSIPAAYVGGDYQHRPRSHGDLWQ